MIDAAERIGERVDRADRRIGKGLAGKHRAAQHRLARRNIAALETGSFDIGRQQPERLDRQHVGDRILGMAAGKGLDRMNHRVDSGGGGNGSGQPEGQRRVEQRDIGEQIGRDDSRLGGFAGGQDRNGGHL